MAQLVEHILGKDEVTGSIPVISSKKALELSRAFIVYKIKKELLMYKAPFFIGRSSET